MTEGPPSLSAMTTFMPEMTERVSMCIKKCGLRQFSSRRGRVEDPRQLQQRRERRGARLVNKSERHRWQFAARFRRNAFGWRSQPAIQKVREAMSEIKKVLRRDPVLAAEGAVVFLKKCPRRWSM
jgi:hypothetical protein